MTSSNTHYYSRKFSPAKGDNPCPICDSNKGKCRIASNDPNFILCMTYPQDAGLPDWKYLGETKGSYLAGKYFRKRHESGTERKERYVQNLKLQAAQHKAKREGLAKLPDASQRDRLYQDYLQKLVLNDLDQADLINRGLSKAEIINLSAKSLNSGYILPIKNPDGKILGFQIRLRDNTSGRYRWYKPFGIPAQQQNGELPLAFHGKVLAVCPRVVLVEGTGVKPYLASKLRNCAAIGASGGQFVASKETLATYLENIGANTEVTRLEYAVDAGDIANPAVMHRHANNLNFLTDLGYALDILWWGQAAKTDHDIDELLSNANIQLLTIEEFFQVANYKPRPRLSPLQWLQNKLLPKKSNRGFTNKSNQSNKSEQSQLDQELDQELDQHLDEQLDEPEVFEESPQMVSSDLEYTSGSRLETWKEALPNHKHILDISATGTGKSYDAGRLRPEMFNGVERIIYISNDSRNVTTETLQNWKLLPARHNGLTNKSGKLRRAKSGDPLHTPANCSRTGAIAALRAKAITDTKIICETCPLLNACRANSGDGFGFKNQRAIAFKSNILRSHPASLPSPTEFDYSKTLLIWEEVSESLSTMRQVTVGREDINKAIAVLDNSNLDQAQAITNVLHKLYGLLACNDYHGLDFHSIKSAIPDLIDTASLVDLLKPDLSILDTVDEIADSEFENISGQDKRKLAKVNATLKRITTLNSHEIESKIEHEVLKQWLIEFLDILSGVISHGDLHIQYEKLTISLADSRLREISHLSAANLYLDATMDIVDLEMRLKAPIYTIKQSGALVMPQIYQVSNLGRLGAQRSTSQTNKVEAIIKHLTALDPTTKVIDFKRFTKEAADRGVWFRDSRGSNDFKGAKTFVIVGTPCANIAMLRADFVALTGLQPMDKDPAFAAFVHRHIWATIQQCFGRKSGDRFNQGDQIYFLSDFDLGDLPHTLIESGDITPEAMSNLDLLKSQVMQVINSVTDGGFDLLNASERQLCQYFSIKRGSLLYHLEWINLLLRDLYNKLIHSFEDNLMKLTSHQDLETVNFWAGVTELFLSQNLPMKDTLAGIFEFFAEHIPIHLHHFVLKKLSVESKHKLFSTLAVVSFV